MYESANQKRLAGFFLKFADWPAGFNGKFCSIGNH